LPSTRSQRNLGQQTVCVYVCACVHVNSHRYAQKETHTPACACVRSLRRLCVCALSSYPSLARSLSLTLTVLPPSDRLSTYPSRSRSLPSAGSLTRALSSAHPLPPQRRRSSGCKLAACSCSIRSRYASRAGPRNPTTPRNTFAKLLSI
jgi:hypothetical protein